VEVVRLGITEALNQASREDKMNIRKLCIYQGPKEHLASDIFISYCVMGKLGELADEDLPSDAVYRAKVLARDAKAQEAGATHKILYTESEVKLSTMESAGNPPWVTEISYKPTYRRNKMQARLLRAINNAYGDTVKRMLTKLPLKPIHVLRVDGELYATLDSNMNTHVLRARLES
jgi:hypothetical protein